MEVKENDEDKEKSKKEMNQTVKSSEIAMGNLDQKMPYLPQKSSDVKIDKKKKIIILKITCVLLYFMFIISIEITYRDSLFDKSVKIQEDIRERKEKGSFFYKIWNFFSYFGLNSVSMGIFAIIFIFFPLNSSFTILQVVIYSTYITNLLKMMYRSSRPYWKSEILDTACNGGYGNPSGHSCLSSSLYPSLGHILTNFSYFKGTMKGKLLRILIFCFLILFACVIMISRIMVSAHSINQVIYGCCLGVGIYLTEIYILSYHIYTSSEFINLFQKLSTYIAYTCIHIFFLMLSIIIYFSINNDSEKEYFLKEKIFDGIRCEIKPEYRIMKNDGFWQVLSIVTIIGAQTGLLILFLLLKWKKILIDENVNEWNKSNIKRWFYRLPILILSCICITLYYAIPDKAKLIYIFLFKSSLSFFLGCLGLFSVGIFLSIYWGFANEKIIVVSNK